MKRQGIKGQAALAVVIIFLTVPAFAQSNAARNKLMARRAAIADAHRILVGIIHGIYIDSETTVKDFVAESDEIQTSLEGIIQGAEIVEEYFTEDRVYIVLMSVPVSRLRQILGKDFYYGQEFIEVAGKGAEPAGKKSPPFEEAAEEAWYERIIQVKGYGVPPDDESLNESQKDLMAERAAVMDAYRNLIAEIKGVEVYSETTIEDFVTKDDTILTNINAFVRGARVVGSKKREDGSFEVVLEINMAPLKSIIK